VEGEAAWSQQLLAVSRKRRAVFTPFSITDRY
jgi:hypothetical protein